MSTRADLFACLERLGIDHETVEHPAFFTVEDGRDFKKAMPGGHSKNLFVKDKKGAMFLIVADADTKVDLVGVGKALGAKGRLSFCRPELMEEILGVSPGSATPFTLINESARKLEEVILDERLFASSRAWFHPLENTASTSISPADLEIFIRDCGFEPRRMDLAAPQN